MNLPNKLSVARVLCIPAIVTLLHFPDPACRIAAAALFIIGCLTDFLDGRIARKRNLVTDFGKFIDPVADKLLVLTTLLGKWKTACQMVLISAMLILNLSLSQSWPLAVLAGVVILLTIVSGVDYFVRNKSVLAEK